MNDELLAVAAFNAAYAAAIDNDALEQWPAYFSAQCHYRITTLENEREGLPAGIVWADSRAMLEDRVSALREANIYERQHYRHLIGLPVIGVVDGDRIEADRRSWSPASCMTAERAVRLGCVPRCIPPRR